MKNVQAMEVLIRQAQEARDQLSRQVAQALTQRDASRKKLEMLAHYRGDYLTRLHTGLPTIERTVRLTQHEAFVDKLEEALRQQQGDLEFREKTLASAQAKLLEAEHRIHALEIYVKKQKQRLAIKESRREQKLMDEFAAHAMRRAL